jgi:NAD(P)H dehydrogenase (quinone)
LDLTTTLIVLAHPEQRSFNGAWAKATENAARNRGDTVLYSDLCAMGFDAVESQKHYPEWDEKRPFDPLKAQEEMGLLNSYPNDVQGEITKLKQADRVIFHFPIWWFAPPAILKGWFDRVLAHGELHKVDQRFDNGQFRTKKALFCVTTGSNQEESAFNGKEGDVEMLLWPSAYTLRYLGFTILKPEIVHGVHGYHKGSRESALEARLQTVLDAQGNLLESFDGRPEIPFNKDTDFDEHGQLRQDRQSHSLFIRHSKAPSKIDTRS